ncbi:hypothetical protein [Faecalibacter sp. LW9]|uniref:hypothetical protein n=1 Tax=Faecalibacter sp. LW9 TaxID=3103144 RepID=UPI002AFF1E05|nr:hypothetical protein [Faecalibacter sp. LW9]
MKVKNTVLNFDTTNLTVTNLTLDRGVKYIFYGTSTISMANVTPNVTVNQLNFNPHTSGTTRFSSYNTKQNNALAYLDIPVESTPV